jgi:hypothetical protein
MPPLNFMRGSPQSLETLFLGTELEVSNPQKPSSKTRDHFDILQKLPDWTFPKSDSSINRGFEIVSHPQSRSWLALHMREWDSLLKDLRAANYTSGTAKPSCGIHVHISKNAFSHLRLYKFLFMVYSHPNLMLRLSQRTKKDFVQWAHVKSGGKERKASAKLKRDGTTDHHKAINITNKNTIELRVFNGTTNPLGFRKNIECTLALFDFVGVTSLTDLNVVAFLDFVQNNSGHYKFLNLFIKEPSSFALDDVTKLSDRAKRLCKSEEVEL